MSDILLFIFSNLIIIIPALLYILISMAICRSLLAKKGYPKNKNFGLLWGFFLGIIGIVVCALHPQYGEENQKSNESVKNNSADELIKYKQLLDSGVITQEDFEKKKEELLR